MPVTAARSWLLTAGIGLTLASGVNVRAAAREIDAANSTITVHVFKAGLFRAFGDNHDIRAPIKTGSIDDGTEGGVRVVIDAARMRVLDPGLSPRDRGEVEARMLGPDVLDVARFPEIRFESTAVTYTARDAFSIRGQLTLHGRTRPVVVAATRAGRHYRGSATVKQSEFGIKPVTVAGGTVRVKDEVSIELDIVVAVPPSGL